MAQCECSDPGCEVHAGKEKCAKRAKHCLKRSDMEDNTGTLFCDGCSNDAMSSGLFYESVSGFIAATRKVVRAIKRRRKQ